MNKEMVEKIKNNPDYQELVSKRSSFSIKLTILMLIVYFAFILTIAFDPSFLGTPLSGDSVTTVGIPVGIAIIFFAFVLTGIYTKRANSEFDELNNKIKESVREEI
ncbi:MAG: DUF485 domain-containing protein [Sulfurimonas sp.]|uniref:DUF485 domain-containing protein n=1 Tax=Sulfurimonas sp. TaxID=2022749 RepID=UPI0025D7514A|nr:DUF485 domain-containing protein [Sulfurimonas sp.]MCK9455382.1 DUF485 domain-containing protein [Sulfurimonas sp.]